jgi:hypothetical protein
MNGMPIDDPRIYVSMRSTQLFLYSLSFLCFSSTSATTVDATASIADFYSTCVVSSCLFHSTSSSFLFLYFSFFLCFFVAATTSSTTFDHFFSTSSSFLFLFYSNSTSSAAFVFFSSSVVIDASLDAIVVDVFTTFSAASSSIFF